MLFQSHFRSRYYDEMFKVQATELACVQAADSEEPQAESE
jgi:hypothetical protein